MEFDWVSLTILGTVAISMVNILDSHLISRRMPSLRAFFLPVSIVILIYSLVTFCLFPLPKGVGIWPFLVALGSGLMRAVSLAILLYILKTEEVSLAIPLFHTFPVFVAIMAVPLLGETLGYLQWLAIITVVIGAVIISARRGSGGSTTWLGRPFFLLFGASLLMAVANVLSKYALDYISFWNMYWITSFFLSGVYLLISLRTSVLRELGNMSQRGWAIVIIIVNETLAMVGMVLVFWAMESGPVSLVSTITGSRPIFVFFLALILNRVLPNFILERKLGRGALAVRLIATAMIASGIAIIYIA